MARVFRAKDEVIKALKMRDEQGLSYKQISEATGIPTSTLKSSVSRDRRAKECGNEKPNEPAKTAIESRKPRCSKPVQVESAARHKENIDKDMKAEIRELQMQVAILRDFLSRKERG